MICCSQWVLMNMQTRRMARMPSKVREEITPFFHDRHAISEEVVQKIRELDDSAMFVQSGLKVRFNYMVGPEEDPTVVFGGAICNTGN